ncbi:MAG: hypothetical protein KKB82_06185 [Candidatus Omnitrophica bacterium]|nr:hypothetical protein [Candidatus Omnitrophota bacterium]MBU2025169.1 hypothetical protein [Patescibacteria group bacterium]
MKTPIIINEIRFSKPAKKFDFKKELLKSIAPKKFKNIPPVIESTQISLKDENAKIVVENSRVAISMHNVENISDSLGTIYKFQKKINDFLEWEDVSRIGLRFNYVKQVNLSFVSLLGKFKKYFYSQNSLIDGTSDLAVVLDFKVENGSEIHYKAGPMDRNQLKKLFPNFRKPPSRCIFFDIDFFKRKETKFSNKFLKDFLTDANNGIVEKIQQTSDITSNN